MLAIPPAENSVIRMPIRAQRYRSDDLVIGRTVWPDCEHTHNNYAIFYGQPAVSKVPRHWPGAVAVDPISACVRRRVGRTAGGDSLNEAKAAFRPTWDEHG
jgi:hypothetical protein